MLQTRRGAFDMYKPFCYRKGQIYHVPDNLANQYLFAGVAEFPTDRVEKKKKAKKS
jgi:hypothetical protein